MKTLMCLKVCRTKDRDLTTVYMCVSGNVSHKIEVILCNLNCDINMRMSHHNVFNFSYVHIIFVVFSVLDFHCMLFYCS